MSAPSARVDFGDCQTNALSELGLLPIRMHGETVACRLNTNDSWYQWVINLAPEFVNSHRQLTNADSIAWNAYNIPYHFQNTPGSVLVLGAGMGNDVASRSATARDA